MSAEQSYQIFQRYERSGWRIQDLPWSNLQTEQVRPEHIMLARSAVMGESNSIAALHGFLNDSPDDYDFAAFASLWGYEELRHHYAFRMWLERVGSDPNSLPVAQTRAAYPPGATLAATMATNIISELTVFQTYRCIAELIEEPVLRTILQYASADEGRHASAFRTFASARLERHPQELASVLEIVFFYLSNRDEGIKHPVSVFKSELARHGEETIADGLGYFQKLMPRRDDELRAKIYQVFSALTGFTLDSSRSVRRALGEVMIPSEASSASI